MLANGRSRLRIVEIPVMHLEFERSKDAIEDNVELLDHLAVAKVKFFLEINHDFDSGVIGDLPLTHLTRRIQKLGQVKFDAIKGLKAIVRENQTENKIQGINIPWWCQ